MLFYSLIDVSDHFEDFKQMPGIAHEKTDSVAWEKLFHKLPREELEVFVLLYLGLKPKEIMIILNFEKISQFYNINARLKKYYRELKVGIF